MLTLKKKINAIHIADLEGVLGKYGRAADFKAGAMKCVVCGDTVTAENAGSVKFTKGTPSLVCSSVPCYGEVMRTISQ